MSTDVPAAPVRWGILATGRIASSFADNLAVTPHAELAAVGSRSAASARGFADRHGVARAHGSYRDLVEDPDVDVVYVASPHALHLEHARLAFEAGKHVLCEKPLTLNVAEAEEMIALARQHDRFLMEAMWMACHPLVRELVAGFAEGRFGEPRQVIAGLGFRVDAPPSDRLLDPALGGGALVDMGIYPLTFAHLVLGEAEHLVAVGSLTDQGVDGDVAIAARYRSGAVAALTCSLTGFSPRTATVVTSTGRVEVPRDFHHPAYATYHPGDGEAVRIDPPEPVIGTGLGNEALEVQRCLAAGLRESPQVPHARTLTLMRQMDALRAQLGVRYAAD